MNPLISVIIPCFNSEAYLDRCLTSLKTNKEPRLEFLIVNDGSTDGTASIISNYYDSDSRFRIVQKPNGGYPSAINAGIDSCTGEYVLFLGSDDAIVSGFLDVLAKHLAESKPEVCAFRTVVNEGGVARAEEITWAIQTAITFNGSFRDLVTTYPKESAILYVRDTSRCYLKTAIGSWREHGRYGIDADGTFSLLVCTGCSSFSFLPIDGYIWNRRHNSVSGSKRTVEKQIDITSNWLDFFQQLRKHFAADLYSQPVFDYLFPFLSNAYKAACACGPAGLRLNSMCRKEYKRFYKVAGRPARIPLRFRVRLSVPRIYHLISKFVFHKEI